MVQWIRLLTLTAVDSGSIPGQGTKIPQAIQGSQKKKFLIQLEDNRTGIGCALLLRSMGNTGRCDNGEEDVLILRGGLLKD